MTPAQRYVEKWLLDNDTNARQLSRTVFRGHAYVTNWLRSSKLSIGPVRTLHPVVKFPPDILRDAEIRWLERQTKSTARTAETKSGTRVLGYIAAHIAKPSPIHWLVPGRAA